MHSIKVIALLLGWLSWVSCRQGVQESIAGVYFAEWQTEFAQTRDTLRIEVPANGASQTYSIVRRTRVWRQGKPVYQLVRWTGIYNGVDQTLVVNSNGRVLSFDPGKGTLKMGETVYQKIQ